MKGYEELLQEVEDLKTELKNKNGELETLKKKIATTQGWKGKDTLKIVEEHEDAYMWWRVEEHRQEKETGEVKVQSHVIPEENVRVMDSVLHKLNTRTPIPYRVYVPELISLYQREGIIQSDVTVENVAGGVNRARVYFPMIYYPLKILEYLGAIDYSGRGDVTVKAEVKR